MRNLSSTPHFVVPPVRVNVTTSEPELFNTTSSSPDPLITLRVPAIMFASGVIGNLLAIVFLVRSSREHKQTVFYRLVGALACTDLFGTCATSPVTLAVYANKMKWVGGEALCNYESFMLIFAGYSTILIIGVMAIDRFISMSKPYFYEQYITTREAHIAIVSLWSFAAIMGCLPIFGLGENIIQFPGTWCFFTFTSTEIKNKLFTYCYASLALLVVGMTAVSNVYVTLILLKMRRKAMKTMNLCSTRRNDSELQMMVLLLGIIIVFSTCWCPFMIRLLVNQTNESQKDVNADLLALRLASLNQILDPWIYILFRRELFVRTYRFISRLINAVRTRVRACLQLDDPADGRGDRGEDLSHIKRLEQSEPLSRQDDLYNQVKVMNGGHTENSPLCVVSHEPHEQQVNHVTRRTSPLTHIVTRGSNGSSKTSERLSAIEDSSDAHSHCSSLNLKHEFCLFCLSNHPKHMAQSTKLDNECFDETEVDRGDIQEDPITDLTWTSSHQSDAELCSRTGDINLPGHCTCNG